MPKSSKPKGRRKPHPDFPLLRHESGRWCKKIRPRFHYFGKVADDPDGQEALAKWLDQNDDLLAGRKPRATEVGFTLRDLFNRFLTAKRALVDSEELSVRTFGDYLAACQRIGKVLGLRRLVTDLDGSDFEHLRKELAKGGGVVALGNEITRARVVFAYAHQSGLIAQPVRFGAGFIPRQPHAQTMSQEIPASRLSAFQPGLNSMPCQTSRDLLRRV